jgi:hypothetical protein
MKTFKLLGIVLFLCVGMSFLCFKYEKLTVVIQKTTEDEIYRYYQFDSVYNAKANRLDLKILYTEKHQPIKLQIQKKYRVDAIKRNPVFNHRTYESSGKILLDSCDKEEKYSPRNKDKDCVTNCITVYAEYYEIIDFEKLK